MKVYVGISCGAAGTDYVCGVSETRELAQRLVEEHRGTTLYQAKDGSNALDDKHGDMVGLTLVYDVFGKSELRWRFEKGVGITAKSFFGNGDYVITCDDMIWNAALNNDVIAEGTLEFCMMSCRKHDDMLEDEKIKQEESKLSKNVHGSYLNLMYRLLNPEDLGRAVPSHVRDEVRAVLGLKQCETTHKR